MWSLFFTHDTFKNNLYLQKPENLSFGLLPSETTDGHSDGNKSNDPRYGIQTTLFDEEGLCCIFGYSFLDINVVWSTNVITDPVADPVAFVDFLNIFLILQTPWY